MINFYKYLPVSKEDESWGLTVLNTGCTNIGATNAYPVTNHPAHHHFSWNGWRTLHEYQIIYITKGGGVFESASFGLTAVSAGTIILLFPNERHRYRPDPSSGWDEYWVGVKGPLIDNLIATGHLNPAKPTMYVGFNEIIVSLYDGIIEKAKQESPGYQLQVSGAAFYLLGTCQAMVRQRQMKEQDLGQVINRAMLLFRSNLQNSYSAEEAARELCIGYSSFRKLFKNHTGLSPGQYYLQLKMERAKDLLANSDLPVKEIAIDLNFESTFYFSKLFKEKAGMSPTNYRAQSR